MKKSFFYLAAGLMAISACTSEKVLDEGVHSNVIGFENVVSKQTKADEITTNDDITEFGVFGYYTYDNDETKGILVFNNEEVKKDNTGKWVYDNTRYWVSGANYYFYAYCCGGVKLGSQFGSFAINVNKPTKEERVLTITDYKCNDGHQHDLLYASNEGIVGPALGETAENVPFKFSHILTKVNAKFISNFSADYTIKISDVKISSILDKGNYNPYKGWHNLKPTSDDDAHVVLQGSKDEDILVAQNTGKVLSVDEDGVVTVSEITEAKTPTSGSAYVIPHIFVKDGEETINSEDEVTLSFKVEIFKGDDKVLGRILKATWKPEWKEGYKYTYNIEINGNSTGLEPIVFVSEGINNWNDPVDIDVNGDEDKYTITVSAN